MSRRKVSLLLLTTFFLLVYSRPAASADPYDRILDLKQTDLANLNHVPPVDVPIRLFEARVRQDPNDAVSLALLGDLYTRQARETGDAAGYVRAEAAFKEALRSAPGYSAASASLAATYYAQHRFADALALAQELYEPDHQNTKALVVLADTQFALGNYAEAEAAYKDLSSRGQTAPVLARQAALNEAIGDPQDALDLMRAAAADALSTGGTPESVAWYVVRLGDISYNLGHLQDARSYYASALRVFDNYHLALAGLGKVSAAQGRYDDAISYYRHAADIIPQPDYLSALGDLYSRTGQPDRAEQQYKTVEYIGKLSALNEQIYNRQLANFYSDHGRHVDRALELALAELAIRKDVFGYDAAAWACFQNGDFTRAQTLMRQALAQGTQDARLYFHAGMIAYRLKDLDQARRYLGQAIEINPNFSIILADEAQQILRRLQSQAGR